MALLRSRMQCAALSTLIKHHQLDPVPEFIQAERARWPRWGSTRRVSMPATRHSTASARTTSRSSRSRRIGSASPRRRSRAWKKRVVSATRPAASSDTTWARNAARKSSSPGGEPGGNARRCSVHSAANDGSVPPRVDSRYERDTPATEAVPNAASRCRCRRRARQRQALASARL